MSRFGLGLVSGASGGNDIFTKALLHFDGVNMGTSFQDSALGNSNSWVTSGTLYTADSSSGISPKFGPTYMLSGSSSYLYCSANSDFNLSNHDFTIDFWWAFSISTGTHYITGQVDSGQTFAGSSFFIQRNSSNKIQFTVSDGSSGTTVTGTTNVNTAGTWYHIAATRNGNILRLFINGSQEGGDVSFTGTIPNSSARIGISSFGSYVASNPSSEEFDEYRMSVGIARWTANFAPPTNAYF